MIVSSVQYKPSSAQNRQQPSFKSAQNITLKYVIEKRAHLLPERIFNTIISNMKINPLKTPTLMEIHKKTYAPLLGCKTLDEAQKLFPEFGEMKEANIIFKRITGNIKKINEQGFLKEGFSLKILQDFWANLKTQDDVAKEFGLDGRCNLAWILQKIGFVNYNTNYKTLLKSSDPTEKAIIAAKTTAWNALHPDLMQKRNKNAAQYMKTIENRTAHSKRMIEYFEKHPERKQQISENSTKYWSDPKNRKEHSKRGITYNILHPEKGQKSSEYMKAAWNKVPELKEVMSVFFKDYTANDKILAARLKSIFTKRTKELGLSDSEKKTLLFYNKAFYNANPEYRPKLKNAFKLTNEEYAETKGVN